MLVTFHPVTLDFSSAEDQFITVLNALDKLDDVTIIFTKPNADTDVRIIIKLIDEYVIKNQNKSISFTSLGQLRYLSALQYVDAVIGNSSSGLIEVPSFRKPTINIGDRQKGRVKGDSVIDCEPNEIEIERAINQALSNDFKKSLENSSNPYGEKNSSELIVNKLESIDFTNLIKKKFYNLN